MHVSLYPDVLQIPKFELNYIYIFHPIKRNILYRNYHTYFLPDLFSQNYTEYNIS